MDPHDHRAAHRDPGGDHAHESATDRIASLVGSLADNKAALGRRYAEWAVSAPTLESAVAAAAMAQDELGHARSTYPVLKALGAEPATSGLTAAARRLALLDDELPDWTSFIAANLLVDGVLTTFVAACVDSSVDADGPAREEDPPGGGLAPRARRGVGAAAVPQAPSATPSSRGCSETWEHAGRWIGPDGDPSLAPRSTPGMLAPRAAAQQRERVRAWLTELLGGEGVSIALDEPTDWSRLGPRARAELERLTCPFCAAPDVERIGQWGGQIITAQWRCDACGSYFEAVREDFDDEPPGTERRLRSLRADAE